MKADETIDKYKERLVIKGFRQREGLDFFDTYLPVMRITSIKMVLAIAALRNWEVHQIDVKMTFLNGDLEKVLYMNQLEGFMAPRLESKVCKLVKSFYSLRNAFKQGHQCSPYHCQRESYVSVYCRLRKQRLSSRTSRLLRSRRLSASHKGRELRNELLCVQNGVDVNEISRLKVRHSVPTSTSGNGPAIPVNMFNP
ncbi:calcineurin B-like protein 4 [Tanacetum coccineum]